MRKRVEIWAAGMYLRWTMQCRAEIFNVAIFLLRPELLSLGGTSLGQSEVSMIWAGFGYQDGLHHTQMCADFFLSFSLLSGTISDAVKNSAEKHCPKIEGMHSPFQSY